MRRNPTNNVIVSALILLLLSPFAQAQRTAWRQATDAELASLLPARAQVVTEHIETEMRTASGIVNGRGQFIAGVVLITAGIFGGRQIFALPDCAGAGQHWRCRTETGEVCSGLGAGGRRTERAPL